MSATTDQSNFPTMIIPRETEIKVNQSGQLSIKTPGNLVIQNSGTYSEIESTKGSIRIEENVTVEAVSIRAGQACFIQGRLTAWKVQAKRISLEDRACATIMLLESEHLDLAKTARLVGNFANENEMYVLMAKFRPQLKELPSSMNVGSAHQAIGAPAQPHPAAASEDHLRSAQAILEREIARTDLAPNEEEALREVLFGLRERNLNRVSMTYREAFAEVKEPSPALRQAFDQLEQHFAR